MLRLATRIPSNEQHHYATRGFAVCDGEQRNGRGVYLVLDDLICSCASDAEWSSLVIFE